MAWTDLSPDYDHQHAFFQDFWRTDGWTVPSRVPCVTFLPFSFSTRFAHQWSYTTILYQYILEPCRIIRLDFCCHFNRDFHAPDIPTPFFIACRPFSGSATSVYRKDFLPSFASIRLARMFGNSGWKALVILGVSAPRLGCTSQTWALKRI